jgi:hypothetical protein
MKKYTPYIVILLMTYLVAGFIPMQFNPQYWTSDKRGGMIGVTAIIMIFYPVIKMIIKDMKE